MKQETKQINCKKVQQYDVLRSFFTGAVTPIIEVILMLVLIDKFHATTLEKTLLSISIKSGFLIAIPISFLLLQKRNPAKILSYILMISALASIGLIWSESVWSIIVLTLFVAFSQNGTHPLTSNIYSAYAKKNRSSRFAWSNIFLMLGSTVFTVIFNEMTKKEYKGASIDHFGGIVIIVAISLVFSAFFSYRIPILDVEYNKKNLSFGAMLEVFKKDKFFLYILVAWTLLGFSNIWLLPYRTNILVEKIFGFSYNDQTTLLILIVIPQLTYILFCFPFGKLFDHFNFITMRIFINVLLIFYFGFFFFGTSLKFHILGSFFLGLAYSGGNIAWKMWINKMVPKKNITLYMNIHSGVTGIRMIVAPALGLTSLYHFGPKFCASISITMMTISIIIFLFLWPQGKKKFIY